MMLTKCFLLFGFILIVCLVDYGSADDVAKDEDKMGMEVLYEMVHFFLGDMVQTKNIDTFLDMSTIADDTEPLQDWEGWADYAKGYAAGFVIGLLFTIIMPIIGLCFCCCRACGKCGGKPNLSDSRSSRYRRRCYCTFIIVFNTLALAGVICAFMCSHLIHKALKNENNEGTIGHIQSSLKSMNNFTDDAVTNVSTTVTDDFDKIAFNALKSINETGATAVDRVLTTLNVTQHIKKAKEISRDVNSTRVQLVEVGWLLANLIEESNQLETNLTSIKEDIISVCTPPSKCQGFDENDYKIDTSFSSLDVLKNETENVGKAMDMSKYVNDAEMQIDTARADTKTDIDKTIKKARTSIDEIKDQVKTGLEELREQRNDAMSFYPDVEQDLSDLNDKVKDKSDYIYYGCIGVSCVYLLIVVFYYLGILFGLCGERPGHDAPCCNKGTGANFLMAGVYFTFIFSWILMMLCTMLFIAGGISYTEVCRYFHGHDPQNFKIFDTTLDDAFDISKSLYGSSSSARFSLSQSIGDCQQNKAIFSAIQMNNIFDLDTKINIEELKNELDELNSGVVSIPNVTILSDELANELREFADAGIQNISFDKYFDELNKNLTIKDLEMLSDAVTVMANNQQDNNDKVKLKEQADRLKRLSDEDIPKLQTDVDKLKVIFTDLQDKSDITTSIDSLIKDLKASQDNFNSQKNNLVKEEIGQVADEIVRKTNNSIDSLKTKIESDTARCQPLSDSIYSISDSVCVLIVDPLNGLWFSFGWCLFFFVICLILGVLLANEYRHEYKFGKEFDDPFDTRNHDMMPLTSHSHMDRHPGQPPMHHHGNLHYQQPVGLHNSGYSPEMKHSMGSAPPPYGHHQMHQGEWIVESSPYTTKSSQKLNGY